MTKGLPSPIGQCNLDNPPCYARGKSQLMMKILINLGYDLELNNGPFQYYEPRPTTKGR